MKIDRYICDLCGSPLPDLSNIEKLQIECTAENYNRTYTYYVCPFCANIFKQLSDKEVEELLLNQLQIAINKTNV